MHFTSASKTNIFLSHFLSYISLFFKQCCILLLDRKLSELSEITNSSSKLFPGKKFCLLDQFSSTFNLCSLSGTEKVQWYCNKFISSEDELQVWQSLCTDYVASPNDSSPTLSSVFSLQGRMQKHALSATFNL